MCGIYGFRVRQGHELTAFESSVLCTVLARDMESRGTDSWGGVIFNGSCANIFKGVGKVTSSATDFLRKAAESRVMLGHTRAATVGKISKDNSHPFLVGNVLGVHNGSIYNYRDLNEKYGRTFEVDSQQIFAHINDGLDLTEIDGYGTFFYTLQSEEWKNIYLARTNSGSLCVGRFYKDRKHTEHFVTVWASEKRAVSMAADIIGAYWTEVDIKPKNVYFIGETGEIYNKEQEFNVESSSIVTYKCWNRNSSVSSSAKMAEDYNTYWTIYTAEPIISSLVDIGYDSEKTACDICNCPLRLHKHAKCGQNRESICRTKLHEKCYTSKFKVCRSCGCYLVQGIHTSQSVNGQGKVFCTDCKRICDHDNTTTRSTKYEPADIEEETTTSSANLSKFFSKKAQKKMGKKARKTAAREGLFVAPLPINIRPVGMVPKMFKADNKGVTVPVSICRDCTCDLTEHIWGWCTNSGSRICSAKEAVCKNDIPLCSDCGCHMVDGIHIEANIHPKAIWCTACGTYCCSASEDEDTEATTDESGNSEVAGPAFNDSMEAII